MHNNLEALLWFPVELLIMGKLKKIEHDISDSTDLENVNFGPQLWDTCGCNHHFVKLVIYSPQMS